MAKAVFLDFEKDLGEIYKKMEELENKELETGVSENEAYDMDVELDDEDGILVYEVEFKSGNMKYDYEINAATGAILKHESELDD